MPNHRATLVITRKFSSTPYLLLLSLYVVTVGLYIGLRFNWRWQDGDALLLTQLSENVFIESQLIPSAGAYAFGYAYQALNTFLAHLTGYSVTSLQTYVQPFLVVLLVPVAYITYHAFTGSRVVAALATLFLFLQSEFIFESLRSSHAKLTWILALTMLFLLARSLRQRNGPTTLGSWVIAFYLVAFALITSSVFFSSSYFVGIGFAFLVSRLIPRFSQKQVSFIAPTEWRRLSYIVLSCLILVFIFLFHVYPPALNQVNTLNTIVDQVVSLLLGVEDTGTNPYRYIGVTWISSEIYVILTSLNYLILGISFAGWLNLLRQIIGRSNKEVNVGRLLLALFYTSFAALLAISVVLDLAGALSANMQVRIFPHLMVVAIPLATLTLVDALRTLGSHQNFRYRTGMAILVLAVPLFSAFSLIKATNDPLFSHQWLFHSAMELEALEWTKSKLHNTTVWVGPDDRLRTLVRLDSQWRSQGIAEAYEANAEVRYFLLSDIMRAQASRKGDALPDIWSRLHIYDNGTAELYYRRTATPYQR